LIGINNSPVLLNEPLDEACIDKVWTHNPGCFDPDGDSLVYTLLPSLQYEPDKGITSPTITNNYRFPDDGSFGNSTFRIDSRTGLITWDAPPQIGVYNIAFKVEEYRMGRLIGYVIRDMVIFVKPCENDPPEIETISDTCVTAGDLLRFSYKAYDPNNGDSIYLELNNGTFGDNGPFSPAIPNPATLTGDVTDPDSAINPWPYPGLPVGSLNGLTTIDTINGVIEWDTDCGNIRSTFYQIDFYAHDNFSYYGRPSRSMLTAHKVVTISVIPPRPQNLQLVKDKGEIALSWDPSSCSNVVGYRIYRKIGQSGFSQDTICCDVSPQDMGYELLAYQAGAQSTTYTDVIQSVDNILGDEVCYVVTAMFEDDEDGFEPNIESCGIEACVEIGNDKLYLTNASVTVTDAAAGEMFVSWSKPDSIDDFFPTPYTYRLYRANNNQYPIIPIAENLNFDTDTTFTDTGLDTELRGYNYRVEVISSTGNVVFTSEVLNEGSSIYLNTAGGDGYIDLSWSEDVSWQNQDYEIHRSEAGGPFVPIAVVQATGATTHTYRDNGLSKTIEYCYFIRSTGSHNVPGVKDPLINDSQRSCDFARDDQPPCTPQVTAQGNCNEQTHQVTITKNSDPCADETESVTILFSTRIEGPYEPVETLDYASMDEVTTLEYEVSDGAQTFAGCYVVTATDSFGNVSLLSQPSCIDFCPVLEMSNVFSPNGDGINDVLTPLSLRDVRLVECIIFDRWGTEVSRSRNEISRLWDGRNNNGKLSKEGVYYYVLVYDELGLVENERKQLKGWVMLMR
jgi:gliding motility-associated-like protein